MPDLLRPALRPVLTPPQRGPLTPVRGVGANPKTILGSALIAWWTADDLASLTLSTAAVTEWRDQVAGYAAVPGVSSTRPVYASDSFNGAPSLFFDGVDDVLTCTDAALLAALPDGAEPGEILGIFEQLTTPPDSTVRYIASYGAGPSNARRIARANISGVNRGRAQVGTGAQSVTATGTVVDLSSRHVLRAIFGATEATVEVDEASPISVAGIPVTTNTRLRIGANDSTSVANFLNGRIRDLVFHAPVSSTVRAQLLQWALPRRRL